MKKNKTKQKALVNLFIVGEQKSGTTFLYDYLKQIPDACASLTKEPVFFAKDLIKESIEFHGRNLYYDFVSLEDYHRLFPNPNKKIVFEASSTYLASKVAAREISLYNPRAKIIILLREPLRFLYSLHQQYLKETVEDVEDFFQAISLSKKRKMGQQIPKRVRAPSLMIYTERIKYSQNIKRFIKYFPPEQILVIIFEELIKNPEEQLLRVHKFLGLKEQLFPLPENRNPRAAPRLKPLFWAFHNPYLKKLSKI